MAPLNSIRVPLTALTLPDMAQAAVAAATITVTTMPWGRRNGLTGKDVHAALQVLDVLHERPLSTLI